VPIAFIALGSNLGDRLATLQSAVDQIRVLGTGVVVSSVYETEPVGYLDQPPFLNAVAQLETDLNPDELFGELQRIERDHARVRTFKNGPRTLDLDLLLYDDLVDPRPGLTIPHPRMTERAFVLAPLAEIQPGLRDPVSGRTVAELLAATGAGPAVVAIGQFRRSAAEPQER
jgi:2-amino-4-hydroxy-6-hydroxymethyldihydropteridine diphosphokinase